MELKFLTNQDFSEYGLVLSIPNDNETKTDELQYWRGISTCSMGRMTTGLLRVNPRKPVINELERHLETPEIVTILEGSGIMYFAKPCDTPEKSLSGFKVYQGDSFLMLPGTWHSLILPENDKDVKLLILFKEGTEDLDLDIRQLSIPLKVAQ